MCHARLRIKLRVRAGLGLRPGLRLRPLYLTCGLDPVQFPPSQSQLFNPSRLPSDHPLTLAPRPNIHCHDTRIAWTSWCHVNHITHLMYPCHPQLHHVDPCLKGPFLSQLGLEHSPGERPVSSRRVCFYVHSYLLRTGTSDSSPGHSMFMFMFMSCHITVLGHPISLSSPFVKILDCLGPFLPLGQQASTFKFFMDSDNAKHKRPIA